MCEHQNFQPFVNRYWAAIFYLGWTLVVFGWQPAEHVACGVVQRTVNRLFSLLASFMFFYFFIFSSIYLLSSLVMSIFSLFFCFIFLFLVLVFFSYFSFFSSFVISYVTWGTCHVHVVCKMFFPIFFFFFEK